jgi:hypothetical protein
MGCLLVVLGVLTPRVAMLAIFVFTDWFARAFETRVWPLLGFVFMPYTTLAWMGASLHGGFHGGWAALVVIAVLVDLGHHSRTGKHCRALRRRPAA